MPRKKLSIADFAIWSLNQSRGLGTNEFLRCYNSDNEHGCYGHVVHKINKMRIFYLFIMLFLLISCQHKKLKITTDKQFLDKKLIAEYETIEKCNGLGLIISITEYISNSPDFKKELYKETYMKYDSLNRKIQEKCDYYVGNICDYSFERTFFYDSQNRLVETRLNKNGKCENLIKYLYYTFNKIKYEEQYLLKDTMLSENGHIKNIIDTIKSGYIEYKYDDSLNVISENQFYKDTFYYCIESYYQKNKLISKKYTYYLNVKPINYQYYRNTKGLIDSIIIQVPNKEQLISLSDMQKKLKPKDFFIIKHYYRYNDFDSLQEVSIIDYEKRMESKIEYKWK